jgi:MFS family permease
MSSISASTDSQPPGAGPSLSPRGVAAGWPQIVVLLAASCMPILGTVLLVPSVHSIQEAFAADPSAAALAPLVISGPALFIGLLAPFAGQIVDRLGRKRLLLAAMVAYGLFGTAPLWLGDLRQILVSRVLLGVTEGAIMTVCLTLIADYFTGERRARILGMQTGVIALAATVFVAVGGALGGLGWRAPFAVYSIAMVLAVLMTFLLWEPRRVAPPAGGKMPPAPWRQLRVPLLVTVPGAIMFTILQVGLSYIVTQAQAAVIATLGNIAVMVASFGYGRFARLGTRMLPAVFGAGALGLFLTVATGSPVVIGAGFVLVLAAGGLMLPILLTWAISPLAGEQRGRGTGLWTCSFFLSQFVCGALVSATNSTSGGLTALFTVIAVMSLVMGALTFLGTRRVSAAATAGPA